MKRAARAVGQGVAAFLAALAREVGPREVGILILSGGVYLAGRALWPAAALGVSLVTAGALMLLLAEAERRDAARGKAP